MESPPYDIIEYLVAHGAYVEAARIAAERGELRARHRALRAGLALRRRAAAGARRWAIAGWRCGWRWTPTCRRAPTEIADGATGEADLLAVADAFAERGRPFEAGRAAERARRLAARRGAVPARRRAARRGARARRAAGELREAGLLYERLVAQGSADEAAAARLALGRLLGRLGRHEEAARHLQAAARTPALADRRRWRALCAPLLALGLPRRRRRGGGAAAPGRPVAAARRPRSSWRSRRPRPPPRRRRRAARAAQRRRGDRGRAPLQIRRLLGGGATGRVYEAVDTLLGTPVALKLLPLGGAPGDPERQAYLRFAREAEAAGRLRHPNIVALHDAQPASGPVRVRADAGRDARPSGSPTTGPLPPRRGAPAGARSAGGAGRGARARHRPPRRQAGERLLRRRRQRQARRLRRRAPRRLRPDPDRRLPRARSRTCRPSRSPARRSAPPPICTRWARRCSRRSRAGRRSSAPISSRSTWARRRRPPTALRAGARAAHDQMLLRALAKAPADRFGSAAEMAEAVAAWPLEEAAVAAAVPEADPRARGGERARGERRPPRPAPARTSASSGARPRRVSRCAATPAPRATS